MLTNDKFMLFYSRGRRPIRGKKIHLTNLFTDHIAEFTTKRLYLYGQRQTVRYLCIDLQWRTKNPVKLRFVLCRMEDGRRIILACSDLSMDPVTIIRLYGYRFGTIEEDFKSFKNDFSGMSYRFWTQAMPHLSHFRSNDAPHILESVTDEESRQKVLKALKAGEVYMQSAFIALGITKMLAMKQPIGGTVQKFKVKRTYTIRKVSAEDIRYFLQEHMDFIWSKYAHLDIVQFIQARRRDTKFYLDVI